MQENDTQNTANHTSERRRICDAHAHIYPEKIAAKATEAVGEFYDIPMAFGAGTSENLLESGAKIGVEHYLVCSVATTVKQIHSINTFIAGECAAHPEFIGLGAYHIDAEDPAAVLDEVEELGLRGVKIHPDFQRFDIDDERLMPLYEELERRGLLILIHMGDNRYDFSHPARLARVLERYPELHCSAAHLGGYRQWDEAQRAMHDAPLHGKNLYFDCSSSLPFLEPAHATELVRSLGTDRVMFGVDYPMWRHDEELERFMALDLTEEEREAVLFGNFQRLFLG